MAKLEAGVKTLEEVLCNNKMFFSIPNYQRAYAWDEEQVSQLVEDISDAFLTNSNDRYFCGSIVLANNNNEERYDVIDGQQRLTTFVILCCVVRDFFADKCELSKKSRDLVNRAIRDAYNDDKMRLKLYTDDRNQIDFEQAVLKKIAFEEHTSKLPKPDSTDKFIYKTFGNNRYLANAWELKSALDDLTKETSFDLNSFVEWCFDNIELTVITASDLIGALRIFNVLNARGMQLSQTDIVKSKLMEKLDEKDRAAFKATWNSLQDMFDRVDGFSFDDMMSSYANYTWENTTQKPMSDELEKYFKDKKLDAKSALSDISKFANAYYDAITMQDKAAYMIRYLPQRAYPVAVLAAGKKHSFSDADYKKVLHALVAYCYQNWIAGATLSRMKQTYVNVLKAIRNGGDVATVKNIFKDNLEDTRYNTTKNYKEALSAQDVYSRTWCKPLLVMVEYKETDDSKLQFIEIKQSLQVEHVLPQTPDDTADWTQIFTPEEREAFTNSLGNLTLLSGGAKGKNQEAGNKSFFDKKAIYKKGKWNNSTPIFITQKIADDEYSTDKGNNKKVWDKDAINKRKAALIKVIEGELSIF